jgi:DNA-3-methyladenine glycosylase I
VLQKRAHYREVFHGFDPEKVARMTDAELERLVLDPGIIRHRGKIETFRKNAQAWLTLKEREGDVVAWLWSFVGGEPKRNAWKSKEELPVKTAESDAMSKALKKAGFGFVGSTTLYAYMQAIGMVNDHMEGCFKE